MRRFIPIIIILALMALVYSSGIGEYLTYESLKDKRNTLINLVEQYSLLAPLTFIIIYILSTALSIPGGLYLSIFGGFLFPQPFSTLYVLIGATIGASIIFLAAKTAFGESLKQRAGSRLKKMHDGFEEDAASYLLFLRLVPLFPFWLVNLAPAFFNVSLRTFVWTTFIGIIPGSFVFTQAGVGLGAIFDSGKALSLESIFNVQIRIALLALGLFALLPILIKTFRKT